MNTAKLILLTFVLARVAGLVLTARSTAPATCRCVCGTAGRGAGMLIVPSQWQTAVECPTNAVAYLVLLAAKPDRRLPGLGVLILIHA